MLGPTLLQPAIGWALDRRWTGALANGVRVYSVDAFRTAFTTIVVWSVLSMALIALTKETRCRQTGERTYWTIRNYRIWRVERLRGRSLRADLNSLQSGEGVATGRTQRAAAVGVAEHGSSAVLVTVAPGGELLDRRRIELIDRGLPTHPHHHEGSWAVGRYVNTPGARAISLADAVALVERVRASAARGACEGLEALAGAVPMPIAGIAIRACPGLPPTTEERIADNRVQTFADSVMYREALATAAEARGWSVYWYDRERVFRDAAAVL